MKSFLYSNMAETYCFRDIISLREAVALINIAQSHIFLRFQYCLDESISWNQAAPACLRYIVN